MAERPASRGLAVFLVVTGAVGWYAAFSLTLEKFTVLEDPDAELGCDFSVLVQCGRNLESWQGAVFGFPNPVLGMAGFVVPIAIGFGLLAGARYARWFWMAFHLGVVAASVFVIWLISQSIFVLGTLCPYCMLVWTAVIPLFWVVSAHTLAAGVYGTGAAVRMGTWLRGWASFITLICFGLVVLLAQLELDALFRL